MPSYPPEWNLIYWIVPREADTFTPGPHDAQAAATLQETFAVNSPAVSA